MRCSSTNQFAGYDEPSVTIEGEDVESDGTLTFETYIERPCAECGSTAAETYLTVTGQLEHACTSEDEDADEGFDLELTDAEVEEMGGGRYRKNLFVVTVTGSASCRRCDESIDFSISDSEAAGSFEDTGH